MTIAHAFVKRTILFKGKRLDNGEWVLGSYLVTERRGTVAHQISRLDGAFFDVNPLSVAQFVGMSGVDGGRELFAPQFETDPKTLEIWENVSGTKRTVKFKGKRLDNEEGVLGSYLVTERRGTMAHQILRLDGAFFDVVPNSIAQSTGALVFDGRKKRQLYEADYLQSTPEIPLVGAGKKWEVFWSDQRHEWRKRPCETAYQQGYQIGNGVSTPTETMWHDGAMASSDE